MKSSAKLQNLKSLYSSTAFMVTLAVSIPAYAGVVEGEFAQGSGTFTQTANKTTITLHSTNSITNFTDFNIAAGQEVLYNNDINTRVTNLSRVQNAASVYGKLTADNVNLYLVSPNGVIFGAGSEVNVPNLVVSTSDISDANFMAGNYKFNIKSQNANASIINKGNITIADAGLAAFVAPNVTNEGLIVANAGTLALAAGDAFTLDMYGDKLINFAVSEDEKTRLVKQSGKIAAENGKVILTVQDATTVVDNTINMDGVTEAKDIQVSGDKIILAGTNEIKSNGGNVVIKAKTSTLADGKITNAGGFVETSADEILFGDNLKVDTSNADGTAGEWLIDPTNITIGAVQAAIYTAGLLLNNITIATSAAGSQDGDINVNASITGIIPGRSLTLNAHDDINIASGVTLGGLGLTVNLQAVDQININGTVGTNSGGNVNVRGKTIGSLANEFNLGATGAINTTTLGINAGDVDVKAKAITLNGTINTAALNSGNVTLTSDETTGAGAVNINNAITAGEGKITVTEYDNSITTGAAGNLTSGKVVINSNKGDITNKGKITASKTSGDGKITISSVDGIITVNNGVKATGANGGEINLSSTNGVVKVLSNVIVGPAGKIDVQAGKNIDLNARFSNTVADSNFTLTGATPLVNVLSNNASIQQGITIVNSAGTVKLSEDTYDQAALVNKNITLTKADAAATANVILKPTTTLGATQKFSNYADPTTNSAVILVDGATATIDGITVDGFTTLVDLGERVLGIGFDNAATGSIIKNSVIKNSEFGTFVFGSDNVTVSNSTLENNEFVGVFASYSNNLLVDNSTIKNSRNGVVSSSHSNDTIVQNSDISGGFFGINISESDGAKITDSKIHNNSSGIVTNYAQNVSISGSEVYENIVGVQLTNLSGNSSVSKSNIYDNTTGISSHNSDGLTVNKSDINNNNTYGLFIESGSDDVLVKNSNINSNRYGFYVSDSENLKIKNSNINDSVVIAVKLTNSDGFSIVDGSSINGEGVGINSINSDSGRVADTSITSDTTNIIISGGSSDWVIHNSQINNGTSGLVVTDAGSSVSFTGQNNSFTGQTGQYISLENTALAGATVDVSKVTFDGVVAKNATDLQSFAIEDKIRHKLDDNAVGLITWITDTLFVTKNNLGIQQAVNSSNSGGTVKVNEGTYNEGLIITKNLTLTKGNSVVGDVIVAPTKTSQLKQFTNFYDGVVNDSIILAQDANLNISDITVDGKGISKLSSGHRLVGLGYDNAGGVADNLVLKNFANNTIFGLGGKGTAVVVQADGEDAERNFTLSNSDLSAFQISGVEADGNQLNVDISGNTVSGKVLTSTKGIAAGRGTSGDINDNTLRNIKTIGASNIALSGAADEFEVASNDLTDGFLLTSTGISLVNTNGANLHDNDINNHLNGVKINGGSFVKSTDDNLSGNVIGYNVFGSTDLTIKGAEIYNGATAVSLKSGSDRATIKGGTIIDGALLNGVLANNSTELTISGNTSISNTVNGVKLVNGSNDATVRNSKISSNTNGIYADASNGLTVNNVEIYSNDTGVSLNNGSNDATVKGESYIHNNTVAGIYANNSSGLTVKNSRVNKNYVGLEASGSNDIEITDSKFNGNDKQGILVANSEGLVIDNSNFNNNKTGAKLDNVGGVVVQNGSKFNNNDNDGFKAINSYGVKISDSEFNRNGDTGIYLRKSDSAKLTNVEAKNNYTGVEFRNADDVKIKYSNISNNDGDGVYAEKSDGLEIKKTNIKFNGDNGVELYKSDNVQIINSKIKNNTNSGIYAERSDNLYIDPTRISGNNIGIELVNSQGAQSVNDILTDNTTGILVSDGSNIIISGTNISDGTNGLVVTGENSFVSFSGNENFFNKQADQYISLEKGAMFGDVLDVSSVIFDGIVASTSTDAESFAIEDKINHKMDDGNVGLAIWRENNLFATLNNLGIQQGIDIADNAWTVNIDSGTFNENLFLNKAVNLIGRGSDTTIINGGNDIALTINTNGELLVKGINFTTEAGEGDEPSLAQFAVLVDGETLEKGDNELITINGPLNISFDDILFTGTQDQAALDFRNATTVGGVSVNNVVFASTAANGWLFENVEGGAPSDEYSEGDINFANTVFNGNYNIADIHLINSTVDGFAENVTFVGDGDSPFAREDRVIHDYDLPELGKIFYTGVDEVYAARDALGLGAFARFLSEKTNINDPYFHPDSNAGKIFDGPNLGSAEVSQFNTTNNPKVNLNGFAGGNQTPGQLNNLSTASGEELDNLETGSGGNVDNNNQQDCGVSFGNNFLGDDASLANTNGSCKANI